MHENSFLPNYGDDDVCSPSETEMFKVGRLRKTIKEAFIDSIQKALNEVLTNAGLKFYTHKKDWFGDGIDCKILEIGAKGWQKGKIKIRVIVEFCPDEPEITEPESPLDDIRRMINEVKS